MNEKEWWNELTVGDIIKGVVGLFFVWAWISLMWLAF
jgi:hypothetical protein